MWGRMGRCGVGCAEEGKDEMLMNTYLNELVLSCAGRLVPLCVH